ncbi:MAG: NAD(P)-binding domain-containing protein [Chloroflexi bacterium]|nr:NAD(P)-binding domain-containing protein [Chloroflexota bacterium]
MKIAVIGAGKIGTTMGSKWEAVGHEVVYGSRSPEKYPDLHTAPLADVIAFGDVIFVSIPHGAVPGFAAEYAGALADKIIIDATNAFAAAEISNIPAFQQHTPNARLFRAFNSLGWEIFANPVVDGVTVDHFYCGLDGDARQAVEQLIGDVGINPVYVGDINLHMIVDRVGSLWVSLAMQRGLGRRLAFKMVRE